MKIDFIRTRTFFLTLLLSVSSHFITCVSWAQEKHPHDTTYVQAFEDRLLIAPFVSTRDFDVYMKPAGQEEDLVQFHPNVSNVFGFQTVYKTLALKVGFRLPIEDFESRNYGNTRYFDLNINIVKPKFLIEGTIKDYRGMVDLKSSEYAPPKEYYIRSDLRANYLFLNYIHIFNNKEFSYRSAFLFREKQLKSAGSFLAMASISRFAMSADSAFLPVERKENFEQIASLEEFNAPAIGLGGGYGQTFVLGDFFIGLSGILAIEFKNMTYQLAATNESLRDPQSSLFMDFRLSLGYHQPRWVIGIVGQSDTNFFRISTVDGRTIYTDFSLYVGWRMRPPKFLKKVEKVNPFR